jgi:hypothetical protein
MSFAIQLLKEGEGDEANKREERVRKQSVTKSKKIRRYML